MNINMKKILAIGLICTIMISCLSGCGKVAEPTDESTPSDASFSEAEQITNVANTLLRTHSDSNGKQETVYVIADAEGTPTETIVSEWLKNPDGVDSLSDISFLDDIVNTKGNEAYTKSANGHITWEANGSDIHYQGTTDKELPVTTSISYTLDGKNVSAKTLAGASGHLVITFNYQNNTATERMIDGKSVTLYQPFLVISGLILDDSSSSNISVTNGKIISTGERSVVIGMAMPGLRESLGLDAMKNQDGEPLDIDIPGKVTIEADVKDFELLTTITMISNDFIQELDLDHVETIDDLKDAMDELADASKKLTDGTNDLYDGIDQLNGGTSDLKDGVDRLNTGANTLKSGADDLSSGVKKLADGTGTLSEGATSLADGASQVSDGASALHNGMKTLKNGVPELTDGVAAAAAGASALSDGASQVDNGAKQLSNNISALSDGLNSVEVGADNLANGLSQLQTSIAELPDGVNALYQGTALVKNSLKNSDGQSIYTGLKSIESGTEALSEGLTGEDSSILTTANAIASGADQLAEGADNISSAADNLQSSLGDMIDKIENLPPALIAIVGSDTVNDYLSQAKIAYAALGQMKDGADSISAGLNGDGNSIKTAANGIAAGSQQLDQGVSALEDGAKSLESGIDTIVSDENLGAILAGLASLSENSGTLVGGVDQLASGATLLSEGVGTAAGGASQLADGASALTDGTSQVAYGASDLANGAAKLSEGATVAANGISELAEGSSSLNDGTSQVASGAGSLANGANALYDGASTAADGAARLASGADNLTDGTSQLLNGSNKLADGVSHLLDGAKELKTGMAEFDKDGIQRLSTLVEDDAQELIDRLKAVTELGKEYTSFAGANSDIPGTVQFIIRTESIEK